MFQDGTIGNFPCTDSDFSIRHGGFPLGPGGMPGAMNAGGFSALIQPPDCRRLFFIDRIFVAISSVPSLLNSMKSLLQRASGVPRRDDWKFPVYRQRFLYPTRGISSRPGWDTRGHECRRLFCIDPASGLQEAFLH